MTPEEFFLRTSPEPNSGCWLYSPNRVERDQPSYAHVGNLRGPAHRVALTLRLGRPIRRGRYVCHKCDVKCCVNPDHLYEGTPGDNARDSMARSNRRANISRGLLKANRPGGAAWQWHNVIKPKLAARSNQHVVAPSTGSDLSLSGL